MSLALVVTALYGDLLKRVLSATLSLALLYLIALAIIVFMLSNSRSMQRDRVPAISTFAGALMVSYGLQFGTGFNVELLPALMMLVYMCVPLAFIVVVPRAYPHFDLYSMALYTTILMLPIHAVGFVQQFIDQSFLVSTAYSDSGGVIARNFLEGTGSFNRLPSIFASADRYAGVCAMQILLSLVLVSFVSPRNRMIIWVILFGLLFAFGGSMIAGSRSRILIVGVALFAGGVAFLLRMARGQLRHLSRRILMRTVVVAFVVFAAALSFEDVRDRIAELPVLSMLEQTAELSDVQGRFVQAIGISLIPYDATLFGEGLGVSAGGRPGEFAICALWIEGGIFWTLIMLTIYTAILLTFVRGGIRATTSGNTVLSITLTGCGLFWLFGLLAGFSSLFELSVALLLFPMIAVVAMPSGKRRLTEPRLRRRGDTDLGLR